MRLPSVFKIMNRLHVFASPSGLSIPQHARVGHPHFAGVTQKNHLAQTRTIYDVTVFTYISFNVAAYSKLAKAVDNVEGVSAIVNV
jgi:hypothetical protein